jgi:seryl-tRNA synthetase
MARGNKIREVENQIKKKQEKLFELKEQSDAIAVEIEELLKKKEEVQKAELLEAFASSGRSYEEVIEFLKAAPKRAGSTSSHRGRPRKTD